MLTVGIPRLGLKKNGRAQQPCTPESEAFPHSFILRLVTRSMERGRQDTLHFFPCGSSLCPLTRKGPHSGRAWYEHGQLDTQKRTGFLLFKGIYSLIFLCFFDVFLLLFGVFLIFSTCFFFYVTSSLSFNFHFFPLFSLFPCPTTEIVVCFIRISHSSVVFSSFPMFCTRKLN